MVLSALNHKRPPWSDDPPNEPSSTGVHLVRDPPGDPPDDAWKVAINPTLQKEEIVVYKVSIPHEGLLFGSWDLRWAITTLQGIVDVCHEAHVVYNLFNKIVDVLMKLIQAKSLV